MVSDATLNHNHAWNAYHCTIKMLQSFAYNYQVLKNGKEGVS